jgi:hypothetical protein
VRLRVALERLGDVEGALLAAARAASEMISCRDESPDQPSAGPSRSLREAVERFAEGWSHGTSLVADDAGKLASVLHTAAGEAASLGAFDQRAPASSRPPSPEPEAQATLEVGITDDADRIEILATWLAACAGQAAAAADGLSAVELEAWSGEGAGPLGQAIRTLSSRLQEGADAFGEGASTLRACTAVLWEAQLRARQAGVVPAGLFGGDRGPGTGALPAGDEALDVSALDALEDSRAAVEAATSRAVARLRQAADLAPRRPGPPGTAGGAGGGAWSSVWGLGLFTFEVTPVHELVDPTGFVQTVQHLAGELLDREPYPVEPSGGASRWDTWLSHPARAVGQLIPPRLAAPVSAEDAAELPGPEMSPGMPEEAPTGARGISTGRPFDPGGAGGPIRHLRRGGIRITPRGVAIVDQHLARFGPDDVDRPMLGRLRRIASGGMDVTPTDRTFYTHQLRVFVRYRRLGHATGDPGYEVWNNVHTAALEDYGVREGPHVLYPVGDTTTDYEQAVLRAIGSGPAPVRWYKIEQRLSVMPLETREYLPDTLRDLGSRDLVRQAEGGGERYELTPLGERLMHHPA